MARNIVLVALMLIAAAHNGLASEQTENPSPVGHSGVGDLVVPTLPANGVPSGNTPNLDSLLRLPRGFVTTAPTIVSGASESEWRRRFAKAIREESDAQTSLETTKRDLGNVAVGGSSNQWSVAAPGGGLGGGLGGGDSSPSSSPLSFKLRQKLRADRERIEETEKALRALRIEADLAGVPKAWRNSSSDSTENGRN